MERSTASTRTQGLLTLFDMHTTFFSRAIEGISEEDAYNRLNTQANHIAWLTGSVVQQRYDMIKDINPGLKQTGEELFKNHQGLLENTKYPTFAEYTADWARVSPAAREALVNMDDKELDSEIDMGFMKMTAYELLSFKIYREASIIGQIALWRRLLGYPALKYD